MKKISFITIILVILSIGTFNTSFGKTVNSANAANAVNKRKSVIVIVIPCCPLTIIWIETKAVISKDIGIDDKNNTLVVKQLKLSDRNVDTLRLDKNVELTAEQAKTFGYKNLVILSGEYKILNKNEVRINFKGEKLKNAEDSGNKWSLVANRENPYDDAGLKHNRIVDEFFKSEQFRSFKESGNKNSSAEVKRFFDISCKKDKFYCLNSPGPYNPIPDMDWLIKTVETKRDPLRILSELKASKSVETYTREVLTLTKNLSRNRELTKETFNSFLAFEKRVLADRKLTEEDRKKVLMISSVGRYSAFYWKRFRDENPSPVSAKPIDWDEVVGVDSVCAIAGPEAAAAGSLADYLWQMAQ